MAVKILFLTLLYIATSGANQEPTTVRRCCPFGEKLNQNLECIPWLGQWSHTVVSWDLKNVIPLDEAVQKWQVIVDRPSCEHHEVYKFPNVLLVENGNLWLREEHVSDSKLFCVDENLAIVCRNFTAEPRVYINKCCEPSTLYSDDGQCLNDVLQRDMTMEALIGAMGPEAVLNGSSTVFDFGFPHCDEGSISSGRLEEAGSKLLRDGSLQLPFKNDFILLKPRTFCLEWLEADTLEQTMPTIFTCPSYIPATPENSTEFEYDLRLSIYPFGLLLSVIFLMLTLAVGYFVPMAHHLLHWRCQTCHVACLLVGDLLLAIVQLSGTSLPSNLCAIVASAMHFSFLAAFFWLNTMCFNIWWTFRDIRPTTLDKRQESLRLRVYNAYAWGVPILISVVAVLMDRVGDESVPEVLRPKFGVRKCWFYGENEIFAYFYGPVGVLLAINTVLFFITTYELTCGLWRREVVKTTSERAALGRVCWKLLVVMGITWLADLLSWACGGPQLLWYLTDVINTLQGVFIFIVVVCQPQVMTAVRRWWCPATLTTTSGNGQNQHSSSQDVPSLNDTSSTSVKPPPDETIC